MNASKLSLITFVTAALMLVATAAWAGDSDNPYIDDNRVSESPMVFNFEVTEVENVISEYNLRFLNHHTPASAESIVEDWKQAYKKGRVISGDYVITGYVFLPRLGNWSFTLRHKVDRYRLRLEVEAKESGAIVKMDARRLASITRFHRRVWSDYKPAGMDSEKIVLKAH